MSGVIKISYVLCMCCRSKWLASSFGSKLSISVLNGIAPQMPLLIIKRILPLDLFSNVPTIFSAKLTKVPWPGYIIYGIVKCG